MKVYTGTDPAIDLSKVAEFARRVEAAGYDGLHVSETVHDPFLLALLALQATERITVRTSVALAFVRSPLVTAYTAWDLSKLSGGRFHLGLGSQIRQNIEERYAMPWSAPAAAMREYVGVVRAAFATFRTGELVAYEGTGTASRGCSRTSTRAPIRQPRCPRSTWAGWDRSCAASQESARTASSPTPPTPIRATSSTNACRR